MEEVRYVRDGNSYYLVISMTGIADNDYQLPMLMQNRIPGLLPVHMQMLNGVKELYYEITSYHTLADYYEARKMGLHDILTILLYISHVSEEIDRYLLRGSGLLLKPEYIFWDEQKSEASFCYDPAASVPVGEGLSQFTRFILDHIDYEDKNSVKLAYTMLQESLKENVSVRDFARLAAEYGHISGDVQNSTDQIQKQQEKKDADEREDFVQEGEQVGERDFCGMVSDEKETMSETWTGFTDGKGKMQKLIAVCLEVLTVGCANAVSLLLVFWGVREIPESWRLTRLGVIVITSAALLFLAIIVAVLQRVIQKICK